MNQEVWKWIPGFENQYQASNYGNIKSFKVNKTNGSIMQGNTLKDGRKRVNLNGKKYLVHRLILLTFNPEGPNKEKCLVLHKDGNPSNNSLSNLQWGSYKDNANDELMFLRCANTRKKTEENRRVQQQLFYEDEVWKDILGYENEYQVSNYGRVKSLKKKDLIMSPILGRTQDYYSVGLTKNGVKKQYSIDRLVAQAFLPNPNNFPEVNHIDEDTTNNKVDNLEWVTHSQNVKHSAHKQSYPVNQYDIDYNLIASFPSLAEAERQTGIFRTNITSAIKRNGKAGGYIWKYA